MISSVSGTRARMRWNASNTASSSPFMRARGDDHGPVAAHPEIAEHAVAAAVGGGRDAGHVQRVELQAAGHDHLVGIGADLDDPARRLLALHAEAVDVRQHAAEERPRQAVARIRSRRDPAVDEHRADARAVTGPQQVRPDLGLHHDEQPRLHQPQRPVDDEARDRTGSRRPRRRTAGCLRRSAARSSSWSTGTGGAAGSAP